MSVLTLKFALSLLLLILTIETSRVQIEITSEVLITICERDLLLLLFLRIVRLECHVMKIILSINESFVVPKFNALMSRHHWFTSCHFLDYFRHL